MKYFKKIVGLKCYLSPMSMEDAEQYAEWLNNMEVAMNLYVATVNTTLPSEKEWLEKTLKDQRHVYAIVESRGDRLIGNVGLDPIDHINRKAGCGIFIGDKSYRGKGYGTEALRLLMDYAFNVLNLNNVMLSVFDFNEAARKCYEKVGFKEIGARRKARLLGGEFHDEIYLDLLAEEFEGGKLGKS